MSYQSWEVICKRCGNMFQSSYSSMGGLCAICYNARETERNSSVSTSTSYARDNEASPLTVWLLTITGCFLGYVITSTNGVIWASKLFLWCGLLLLTPVYIFGLVVLGAGGLLTGDWSTFLRFAHEWWTFF